MIRCRVLLGVLLLVAVAAASGAGVPPARAVRADAPGHDLLRATYDDLLDFYFKPIVPVALLGGAWDGFIADLAKAHVAPPAALDPLPSERDAAFDAFFAAFDSYLAAHPSGPPASNVVQLLAYEMTATLHEDHTGFLTPADVNAARSTLDTTGHYVGAGIAVSYSSPWLVTELAPGGPAESAGVRDGDTIVTVNGRTASALSSRQLATVLNAGTVALSIDRDDTHVDFSIAAGRYRFLPLESRFLPGGVGYVRLRSFVRPSNSMPDAPGILDDLDQRLDGFDRLGASGLVLDLRGNSGGAISTAFEILGRFLPEDTLAQTVADLRGHQGTYLVSGQMRHVQSRLAVLVNNHSASASELVASTLKETNRAVIVGERTSGLIAEAQFLPLPGGAGLEVADAETMTPIGHVDIDGSGWPVDVQAPDTRTPADYRSGADPQLDAAVAALAQAPAPPDFKSSPSKLTAGEINAMLAQYMPKPADIPTNDRFSGITVTSTRDLTHVNEIIGASRDPLGAQARLRQHGWLGAHTQSYGADALFSPSVGVTITIYATADGAAGAFVPSNAAEPPAVIPNQLELGDQTAMYTNTRRANASFSIQWRHENVVLSVGYSDPPDGARMDTLLATARLVDAAYLQNPLTVPMASIPAPLNPGLVAASGQLPSVAACGPSALRQ